MKKIILLLLVIMLTIGLIVVVNDYGNINMDDKEIDSLQYTSDVVKKIDREEINNDFIKWIYNKYGIDCLKKIIDLLDKDGYSETIWHQVTNNSYYVLKDLYDDRYKDMDNVKVIDGFGDKVISFVGDVSLADNWYIMPKYDERNKGIYGILSEEIVNIMNNSDIMVVNNEFTISNRGEKMPGKYYTFRAFPDRIKIYEEMGVDLVTLANNHVYDFGEEAFLDTLDTLNKYNIPYIGAGRDIDEAMKPYYFIINGYKVGFVNATRAEKIILTPEATKDSGGVLRCYDPRIFMEVIKNTKKESDFVVALVHYGKEDSHNLEVEQVDSSKKYIESGADMVIGTHAHVLQGIEFYKDKPIFYNLGDFIFNNEDKETGILQVKLDVNGKMEYYFIPAYQSGEYTKLLDGNEKNSIIDKMNKWSINANISYDGKVEWK